MALNVIWIGFFLIALVVALIKLIFFQDYEILNEIVKSLYSNAETGFTLSIGLTAILAFWLGIMKIGENGGAIKFLSKMVSPLFTRLFPEIPKNHPALGSMMMNFSANMLGLDNAATPMGLKAMGQLQELNPEKETASNAQIMFLVLNTSGLTIIPVSIIALRASGGSENPSMVFLPILLATFVSSLFGLIITSIYQKINLIQPVVLAYIGGLTALIVALFLYLGTLDKEGLEMASNLISSSIILGIIFGFIILAAIKKVNVYESFIDGAKEGFGVAIKIIPYLIAMLCAIGVFRSVGAMDYLVDFFRWFFQLFGFDTRFVDGLPTAFMKPLSGSGARGMMVESWGTFGVDSFVGKLTSIFQGSTETTFYVLAVYFGSVGIKNTRYAATAGILADLAGVIAAILITYYFFG
ncbi:MAG: nucleoside recognition domain-containing protein [Flavobacteriales bacterium]